MEMIHGEQNRDIRDARKFRPEMGQVQFTRALLRERPLSLAGRTFYSVYNVVRKHDAMEKTRLEQQYHNELPELA